VNFSTRSENSFDSKTRFRGREYFHFGHVKFKGSTGHSARFAVKGTYPRPYEVYVSWGTMDVGSVVVECDCPYYEDGALCKHIWACLLWIDVSEFSKPLSGISKLRIETRKEQRLRQEAALGATMATGVFAPRPQSLSKWEEAYPIPAVKARVSFAKNPPQGSLRVTLAFQYGNEWIDASYPRPSIAVAAEKKIYFRNTAVENEALKRLSQWILMETGRTSGPVPKENAAPLIHIMISWGWIVEAEGKSIVSSGATETRVSSGVNWFDLTAEVKYGDVAINVQQLIETLDQGEKWIKLGDGTFGMIPEQWVRRHAALASIGEKTGTVTRFKPGQAVFLDGWLQEDVNLKVDQKFQETRERFQRFSGLKPKFASKNFKGVLRPYQEQGLSWLEFLSDFDLGGVLADDMGLGKTVQVLAFLQNRILKVKKSERIPSLIIIPKTLIHNWSDEASKFVPGLKVVKYSGSTRKALLPDLMQADLILVTYQTLRHDFKELGNIEFDYVIADEAQAIKNGDAQISRTCKQVRGRKKLAMTGTPIENSINDLFSILDFANPGLITMGLRRRFSEGGKDEKETAGALSRALKPIILRRTKEQVLKDLPEKTEQTLFCEMSKDEMKTYEGLRDHYRKALVEKIDKTGIEKSKIQILTALLRLRQAACHPALLDRRDGDKTSAKLETLLEQTEEVISEGHKVLIFSQFTSFLAVVEKNLKERGVDFEYLDGKTRDRQKPVQRFQNDPNCKVFLLSLKAGGTGLNLTAADYVFLLDPWWNPAVERQAIDRAHRIGQHRNVFAYRLIARGTVEEKILELQKSKRDLADAIVSEDASFLKKMTREDLQLLLS
jgi:superfamily II DNA or RNA helicase